MAPGLVRRQWVVKTFLVALFLHDPNGWLLKGGTGMMLRLPEARHSKDVDLATALSPAEAVDELRDALVRAPGPYRWEVRPKRAMARDKAGVSLTVTAWIGPKRIESFNIDLATAKPREFVGAVDHVELSADPTRITGELKATIALVPLADQAADKICAMHELHGFDRAVPSDRPRDLIDLLLVQLHLAPRLRECAAAVAAEAASRGLTLPTRLTTTSIPAEHWRPRWRTAVRESPLAGVFEDIDSAVSVAARCWGVVLAVHRDPSAVVDAVWNPDDGRWDEI